MENINSQEENQRAEVAPGANTGRVTIPTDLDVVDQIQQQLHLQQHLRQMHVRFTQTLMVYIQQIQES